MAVVFLFMNIKGADANQNFKRIKNKTLVGLPLEKSDEFLPCHLNILIPIFKDFQCNVISRGKDTHIMIGAEAINNAFI